MVSVRPQKSENSRLFVIENRAGPGNAPIYQGLWKAGAFTWSQGDVTIIRIPDPTQYGAFQNIGKTRGEPGNPEITLTARYTLDRSAMLDYAQRGCDLDIRIHMGLCQNPQDGNRGWDKILVIEAASPTSYTTTELGALDPSERAMVNEELPVAGEDAYEITKMSYARKADAEVVREVVAMVICDTVNCGDCGNPSDGCERVFALVKSSDASPGLWSEVVYSEDGGLNWNDVDITTLTVAEDPNDGTCVGGNLIVVSQDSVSLHWAEIADILNNAATWAEVTTGFVAGGAPRAIFSASPVHTWVVGAGGYVYFTDDPTSSVTVQDAGVATIQQLNKIHGVDELNLVAVGNSNAVIYTTNGGTTWTSVTGPSVGVNLNAVWMRSATEWIIGTAGGRLYYTQDSGVSWTEKSFSGSGAGVVRDIKFATPMVGYMAHDTAAPAGRLFRTIDGGYSWYLAPEDSNSSIPANDRLTSIAVCADVNKVFAGGLADDALDGIIIQGA